MQDLKGPLYLDFQEILPWHHMHHQGVKQFVLLSTMHHTATTEGDDKPETVHYNKTKSGVDNMDHLALIFSCRRKKQSMANGPLL